MTRIAELIKAMSPDYNTHVNAIGASRKVIGRLAVKHCGFKVGQKVIAISISGSQWCDSLDTRELQQTPFTIKAIEPKIGGSGELLEVYVSGVKKDKTPIAVRLTEVARPDEIDAWNESFEQYKEDRAWQRDTGNVSEEAIKCYCDNAGDKHLLYEQMPKKKSQSSPEWLLYTEEHGKKKGVRVQSEHECMRAVRRASNYWWNTGGDCQINPAQFTDEAFLNRTR